MKPGIIVAAAVALVLASAGSAAAATTPPQASPAPWAKSGPAPRGLAQESQAWVSELAHWMQGINGLLQEQVNLLKEIGGGRAPAQTFYKTQDLTGGAAWAADWTKARHVQLAAHRAHVEQIMSSPFPKPPAAVAKQAPVAAMVASLTGFLQTYRTHLTEMADQSEELIQLIDKTANGDPMAARLIDARGPEIAIAMLRGESDTLNSARILLQPGDPQGDLITTSVESNLAMIELLQLRRDEAMGTASDRVATANRMRQHVAAARAGAEQLALDASSTAHRPDLQTMGDGVFRDRIKLALATYAESAKVEQAIADKLGAVANLLEKKDMASENEMRGELQSFGSLVQRRIDLDAQRKRIIAGDQ